VKQEAIRQQTATEPGDPIRRGLLGVWWGSIWFLSEWIILDPLGGLNHSREYIRQRAAMMSVMQEAGTQYRWRLQDPPGESQNTAETLSRSWGVGPLVAQLLADRLDDPDDAPRFLDPKLSHLHDPALLPGSTRAAKRLAQAINDSQPILIYGDYDVDGVTASAVLWHTLKLAGADVHTYIPHRLDEGYGLNSEAIVSFANDFPVKPLVISVDCGITAIEPAGIAKEHGIDLIITDHHQFDPDALPDAHTLVHPELKDSASGPAYPFAHLCGAGVAFKVAWQFARELCGSDRLPDDYRELMVELLSLVALGTVADVVPLVDENRVLTTFGLGRIKQARFAGLNALIDAARLREETIDAYHVGFVLGPRLNACGRMGHAKDALELLTTATGPRATELARFLTDENDRRRAIERKIADQAKEMVVREGYDAPGRRAIVVGAEGWHPGVAGIVASRLVDAFNRPAVVLCFEDGLAQGSARSVEGVSIHDALSACEGLLDRFGGHAMAAGLALPVDRIDALRDALVEQVNARLGEDELTRQLRVDAEVQADDCTLEVFDAIEKLAPFGRGNPRPRLLLRGAVLDRAAQRMGGGGKHLSLTIRRQGRTIRAVAFGMGEHASLLPGGVTVDLLFEPKINCWQGVRRPELHVKDFRVLSSVT
jgi:single-stranded-DNA-specific exonuclease